MSNGRQASAQNTAIVRVVDGWSVAMDGEEPRILDEELGARLGFSRPAAIRDLIKRLVRDKKLSDIRCVRTARMQSTGLGRIRSRLVDEHWLTEAQALKVIAKSETAIADAILDDVIAVFIAVRRGQLATPQQVPVLSTSPLVGDSRVHRAEMVAWCTMAARNNGVTVHRIHGELRRQCRVPSVYQIPLVLFPQARELVESLALGRLLLPGKPNRRLAVVPDPAQRVLPFPTPAPR